MAPTISIVFQGPMDLSNYDRSLPAESQVTHTPQPFLDCMAVREEVFVRGQNIPLLLEADADDCRCYHWVAYTKDSENNKPMPVGTIRVVPFPQEAHPEPGSSFDLPENPKVASNKLVEEPRPWIVDRATTLHDGLEPYLKLGRMAVIKAYEKQGIARALVEAATAWATKNGVKTFSQPGAKDEQGIEADAKMTTWNGLLCVHAQQSVIGFWQKTGFVIDEEMGEWTEAGIKHVGMFRRLAV